MIYKLGFNYKNILGIFRILYNNGIWISYINLYFALIGNRLKPASARFLFGCGLCVTQNHAESQHKSSPNILQTPPRNALYCRFDMTVTITWQNTEKGLYELKKRSKIWNLFRLLYFHLFWYLWKSIFKFVIL